MAFWRPDVALLVALLGVCYAVFAWHLRRSSNPFSSPGGVHVGWRRHSAFSSGLILLYVVQGPLQELAQRQSFSAYVLQMLLMTMALPWLLVFSLPSELLASVVRLGWWRSVWRSLVQPVVALVTYTSFLTAMLLPPIQHSIVTVNWLHVIVSPLLFLSAICFWWPLASPLAEVPSLTRGRQLFYLAYASNFMMPVIVYLFLAQHPWYDVYLSEGPGRALADQQLGSVVMLLAMYAVYGGLAIKIYSVQDESIWYA